jgi:hypothetical protein
MSAYDPWNYGKPSRSSQFLVLKRSLVIPFWSNYFIPKKYTADECTQPVDIEVIVVASIPDNLVDDPIEPVDIFTPASALDLAHPKDHVQINQP